MTALHYSKPESPNPIQITHPQQVKNMAFIALGKSKNGHCIAYGIKTHDWDGLLSLYLYVVQNQLGRIDDVLDCLTIVPSYLFSNFSELVNSLESVTSIQQLQANTPANTPAKQGFYWHLKAGCYPRFVFHGDLITQPAHAEGMLDLTQGKYYGNHLITATMQNGYKFSWVSDGFADWVIISIYEHIHYLSGIMDTKLGFLHLSLTDNPKHANTVIQNLSKFKPIGRNHD